MRKRRGRATEVFLSHATRDRRFASRIADVVRAHGVQVWYSRTHIVGAQEWHDAIGAALARCDWFALVLSPASITSRWVKHELLYVLREPKYVGRIVPILYRPCDPTRISWTLSGLQYVDFTKKQESGFQSLLRVWGLTYDPTLADGT